MQWKSHYRNGEQNLDDSNSGAPISTSCKLSPFSLSGELEARNDRRARLNQRRDSATRREEDGKKPFFLHANEEGRPYGYGIGAWNDALGKVVRGLDPSYIDIRHLPHYLMETLIQRLNDDFDFSHTMNPTWLRARIGGALSSYRHSLIKIIECEGPRPQWVSEVVWERLVKMHGTEKYKEKSEQMKYANACRRTKGRTGPIGIAGVEERLRQKLGRTPDPDELQAEVTRDKGYHRKSKAKNQPAEVYVEDAPEEAAPFSHERSKSPVSVDANGVDPVPPSLAPSKSPVTTRDGLDPITKSTADAIGHVISPNSSTSQSFNSAAANILSTVDLDIAFARKHPLGTIILKQMSEL